MVLRCDGGLAKVVVEREDSRCVWENKFKGLKPMSKNGSVNESILV